MGKDKVNYTTQTQEQSGRQTGTTSGSQANQFSNMQGLDPKSQAYIDWQRQLARGGAGAALGTPGTPGPNAGMLGALQGMNTPYGFGGGTGMMGGLMAQGGQLLGAEALQGQASALMNPYVQGVIDPTRQEFDRMRAMGRQQIGDQAQAAGAFGGSRHGVAEGVNRGEIDRAQGQTIADLYSGGYDKAMQAALQLQAQTGSALGGMAQGMGDLSALDLERQKLDMQRQQQLFGNYDYLRQIAQQQGMDPVAQYQQALGFANMGMGPVGYQQSGSSNTSQSGTNQATYGGTSSGKTTNVTPGNLWNDILGGAMTFGPMLFGAPPMLGNNAGASSMYPKGISTAPQPGPVQSMPMFGTGGYQNAGQPLVRDIYRGY